MRQAVSLAPATAQAEGFSAIWDTGASQTAISPRVVARLGLKPFSVATVHFGNSTADCPVYKVDVLLPNGLAVLDVNATEAVNIQGADVLIGMDIITSGDLADTNANRQTFFSFRFPPALDHIDYVADANKAAKKKQSREDLRRLRRKGKLR